LDFFVILFEQMQFSMPTLSSYRMSMRLLFLLVLCWNIFGSLATPVELADRAASPEAAAEAETYDHWEYKRTEFPDYPPSCKLCERDYVNIDSCANASVVFANLSVILYSPLMFFEVINCACSDTFRSAFPQCVDCFEQTNQTVFLEPENGANMSTIVTNIRSICALGSAVFGGVATVNSQLPGQTPITVASAGAAFRRAGNVFGGEGLKALAVGSITMLLGIGMGVWTVL
jgi:hypothetical protein